MDKLLGMQTKHYYMEMKEQTVLKPGKLRPEQNRSRAAGRTDLEETSWKTRTGAKQLNDQTLGASHQVSV